MDSFRLRIVEKFDWLHNKLQISSSFSKSELIKNAAMRVNKVSNKKSRVIHDEKIIQPIKFWVCDKLVYILRVPNIPHARS